MAEKNPIQETLNPMMDEQAFAKSIAYLHQAWSYIEIRVVHKGFEFREDAVLHEPQPLIDDPSQQEFVYTIFDHGDRLLTTKAIGSGSSMIKMHYTIEKMIALLYQKYQESAAEAVIDEFEIYLEGELSALRKAFEVIINLPDNWVVMNFEPGEWGSKYLETLQKLYDKGFPYPPAAPRDYYRHLPKDSSIKKTAKSK